MKLRLKLLTLLISLSSYSFAQESVKMTSTYGSENRDIQDLLDFENVFVEKLDFLGDQLKGKSYVINIAEYRAGKLVGTTPLFDGTETSYFKIKENQESIKFMFKMSDGKLKTYIRGAKFGSKKSYFTLVDTPDKYALKDFFGRKKELAIDLKQTNTILAIITPTIHADGSGSYCEVAQSDIMPEKLGEHFKIPHHFLITIDFK